VVERLSRKFDTQVVPIAVVQSEMHPGT